MCVVNILRGRARGGLVAVGLLGVAIVAIVAGGCGGPPSAAGPATTPGRAPHGAASEPVGTPRRERRTDERHLATLLSRPLSIHDAVQIALLENRLVRAWIREVGVDRGALVDASLPPNPRIEGSVRFPERGDDPVQVDLALSFDLANTLLTPLRADLAGARLDAARYRSALAILGFAHSVRIAFVRCQADLLRAELVRGTLELWATVREAARATGIEPLEEDAELARLGNDLLRAELALDQSRRELTRLLGVDQRDALVTIDTRGLRDPPSEALEPADLESRAIDASIELAWFHARIEALARAAGLARAEGLLPMLELGARAELDERHWEIGPRVAVELPLFSHGEGLVVARDAELTAARERHIALAVEIRAAVRTARNRVVTAQMIAARHRDVLLPAWARALAAADRDLAAGAADRHTSVVVRLGYLAAALGYLDAVQAYWEARVTLDQILAGQVPSSVLRSEPR